MLKTSMKQNLELRCFGSKRIRMEQILFELTNIRCSYGILFFQENEIHKITRHFEIQTDLDIPTRITIYLKLTRKNYRVM